MSTFDSDYKFETYEEFYGDIKQVQQLIDACQICGSRLMINHLTDYTNLLVQESAICPECGNKNRKKVHVLN
ncbi:MAG: hypothetical protein A2381_12815 [Bdellovibrionales bacterium RIFOXYB1_FULL_37_110]|nr:MAG: hypothetical protein A2181_02140 [Bdellovibrionales bacterium RIFOXYA1_FULL_38_20]OFZ51588.1 MAG: hypothetical protein A2417_12475 [Bdellovibrionales bacterium RIFOXYC1_FULL_37_79]OFZ60415.1 MAG: hypothetical protein A2381_12815 [Bdellovibrionales bacterium RIFOXYB1_FULL_37_110]OFZ64988.1 MAG: hypothetical protein A2577_09080 [Bdellovibrionales bacterium RIFOXYD1_FULL_36_51]